MTGCWLTGGCTRRCGELWREQDAKLGTSALTEGRPTIPMRSKDRITVSATSSIDNSAPKVTTKEEAMKHQSKSGLRVFVRGRWSRAAIGAGAVLGAVSAVGVFAVPVAGAPSTSGKLTISGATQGSWELTNGNQCSVSRSGPIQIKLDGTVVTNPVTNELGGSYPTLTIGQWKRNAPPRSQPRAIQDL